MSAAREAQLASPGSFPPRAPRARARSALIVAGLLAFLALSVALGLWVGRGRAANPELQSLFLGIRAYRVGVGFFAGAALAVSGAIVQGLFRNPLATPMILGTDAGALLGGKLALYGTFLLLGGRAFHGVSPEMLVPLGCIAGAIASLVVVLSVSSLRASPVTLILTGFVLNGLFLSIGTFVSSLSQDSFELHRAMSSFATGSISGVGSKQLALAALLALAGSVPPLFWSSSLDLLLSGEEEASSLGVEVPRVRFWCVVWAALATAGAVAVGGGVGFIGLVVPHVVRRFTGPAHRYVLPGCFITGGCFLILCDAACRGLPLDNEIPLQALTDVLGAPAFLWLLRRYGHEARDD